MTSNNGERVAMVYILKSMVSSRMEHNIRRKDGVTNNGYVGMISRR